MALPVVEVCADPAERVAALVQASARTAIESRGSFIIAIAGGSLVKMLGTMKDLPDVEWDKWHVAWVDERCVPHSHADSNFGGAREAWLSKVPIPESQTHAIHGLCPGGGGEVVAQAAAADKEERLRALPETVLPISENGFPVFDLLLLGFGPDGHICSLFPDHPLLEDTSGRWVLPIADSPKPPSERITVALPVVHSAKQVVLVGTGDGKKEVVRDSLVQGVQFPCARTRSTSSSGVTWVLDNAAASLLPELHDAFERKDL